MNGVLNDIFKNRVLDDIRVRDKVKTQIEQIQFTIAQHNTKGREVVTDVLHFTNVAKRLYRLTYSDYELYYLLKGKVKEPDDEYYEEEVILKEEPILQKFKEILTELVQKEEYNEMLDRNNYRGHSTIGKCPNICNTKSKKRKAALPPKRGWKRLTRASNGLPRSAVLPAPTPAGPSSISRLATSASWKVV